MLYRLSYAHRKLHYSNHSRAGAVGGHPKVETGSADFGVYPTPPWSNGFSRFAGLIRPDPMI
jgi:hypothetical protein